MMTFRIYSATDTGRVRAINEDYVGQRALAEGFIAVVADGVGGSPGGAFASRLVVEHILETAANISAQPPTERLALAGTSANEALRCAQREHPGYGDMATTVVAMLAQGGDAAILHAGDSRCYLWRNGSLSTLTRDHTVAEQMVDDGTITPADVNRTPYQHILTRALGLGDSFAHTVLQQPLQAGDTYLLCSDGLNKPLGDGELAAILKASPIAAAAEALIAAANQAGGQDNISVILIHCEETTT